MTSKKIVTKEVFPREVTVDVMTEKDRCDLEEILGHNVNQMHHVVYDSERLRNEIVEKLKTVMSELNS